MNTPRDLSGVVGGGEREFLVYASEEATPASFMVTEARQAFNSLTIKQRRASGKRNGIFRGTRASVQIPLTYFQNI